MFCYNYYTNKCLGIEKYNETKENHHIFITSIDLLVVILVDITKNVKKMYILSIV